MAVIKRERGKRRRMKAAENATPVRKGSDNVFADLGFADPVESLAKAKLAGQICKLIAARGLTQT